MARKQEHQPLYETIALFRDRCLISDRSLIWPDQFFWTFDNLKDIHDRIVVNYIAGGEQSFEEKIGQQLQGASPALWAILADMLFVHGLPSNFIKYDKKIGKIQWAARNGGLTLSDSMNPGFDVLKQGFSRTGQRYHQKIWQIISLINIGIRLKSEQDPKFIFEQPKRLQSLLDGFRNEDISADIRHALLYMLFPDTYESIISTRDKLAIQRFYGPLCGVPNREDVDGNLLSIRNAMIEQGKADNPAFSYYVPPFDAWRINVPPGPDTGNEGAPTPRPQSTRDSDVNRLLSALKHTKNVILYGPPGTGKTYIARLAANTLVENQISKPLSEETKLEQVISGLTIYGILALAMYQFEENHKFSVPELLETPLIKTRFRMRPVQNPSNALWGYLQNHTPEESETVHYTQRQPPFLFDKDEQSLWRLIGEGRRYVEGALADRLELLRSGQGKTYQPEDFIKWVTFHQSYSYEDFIEGLRPTISEEQPEHLSYEIVPGVFRELCDRALNDPTHQYVLVIDEINRGNIAKIMGELITLIEDDKRDDLALTLPYSGHNFKVPGNLTLIGTMNTTDRSIALLDVALRRRFAFVEIMPRSDLLANETVEYEAIKVHLDVLMERLNRGIRESLDRNHQIGHSYFLRVIRSEDRLSTLEFVWNHQIMPLLQEYYYSRRDKLVALLSAFQDENAPDAEQSGEVGIADGEDLLAALAKFTEV